MHSSDDLRDRVTAHFQRVHREVFLGDPAVNDKLKVEVVAAGTAGDTPFAVIVTPWMLNGLAFPPDAGFPERLEVATVDRQVFFAEIEGLGSCHMVPLADVSALPDHESARTAAAAFAGHFEQAVARAREVAAVDDPGKRRMLRGEFGRG